MRGMDSKEHQGSNLTKAIIRATVALGAYNILNNNEVSPPRRCPSASSTKSGSSRSSSPHVKHHDRHLSEEILGAYSMEKELMGDKKHHVTHMVMEAIGAAGAWQDMKEKERAEKRVEFSG